LILWLVEAAYMKNIVMLLLLIAVFLFENVCYGQVKFKLGVSTYRNISFAIKDSDFHYDILYKKKNSLLSDFYIGLNYKFSNFFDIEITANKLTYSVILNDRGKVVFDPKYNHVNHDTFAVANRSSGKILAEVGNIVFKDNPATCCNIEGTFFNKREICGINTVNFYRSSYLENKVYFVIISARIKPFKENKEFIPYLSAGLGLAFNKSKLYYNDVSQSKTNLVKKKNSNSLVVEIGLGSSYSISNKTQLDISLKYIDYGTYKMANNIKNKIKGISVMVGVYTVF